MQRTNAQRTLRRATLEMSLKPFKSLEPAAIEAVCEEALRQWKPLLDMAETASMLLWIADGSEILTWGGEESAAFEWARYVGFANEDCFGHIRDKDNPKIARLYTDHPVSMTYGDLKRIVATFKRVAAERFGVRMEVGATFDAGPEFAYSDFKYKDHPEINRAELGGRFVALKADYTVVCTWSKLKADRAAYAAYPRGIPEATPFGVFFGRQCASFLPAMGFDYIWFSNGFALSYFPWTYLGANYDGSNMPLADARELGELVLSFWDHFKRECPDTRIEIRGTNFGTGMDLAKDAIPMKRLYERGYLEYPAPNSPWGALNFDFGLEMTGYLSRIAELPGETYPFRYYPNDPWFWQNPWQDLYDREPHDVYCPLSAARVNDLGRLESPRIVEILSIDTELGELDETCPQEVVPHIKRAYRDFPDEPGLVTWLYPFREMHEAAETASGSANAAFFHDWFIRNAINEGLPLNTVVGTDTFFGMPAEARSRLENTVLLAATCWLEGERAQAVLDYVRRGGQVLLYGAVRDDALLEALNLTRAEPLEGEFDVDYRFDRLDRLQLADSRSRRLRHLAMIGDGGLGERIRDDGDAHTRPAAFVSREGERRAYALSRSLPAWQGGRLGWVRGSLPFEPSGVTHLPVRQDAAWMDGSTALRYMLQHFGIAMLQHKYAESSTSALCFVKRHDNAFLFAGCKKDTSVSLQLRFPDGEPLLIGQTAVIGTGAAHYALDRTFHDECRVFVKQSQATPVWCRENSPIATRRHQPKRTISAAGLLHAEVTVYPPLEALEAGLVEVRRDYHDGEEIPFVRHGNKLVGSGISGTISISW